MKKYIRTKNGVYDETKVCLIADAMTNEIFVEKMIDGYTSHLEKVIAQSDTIEELCDVFVLVLEENYRDSIDTGYELYSSYDFALNYYDEKYYKFYGAIWTDKGLIYVAKMNDKGELELICD